MVNWNRGLCIQGVTIVVNVHALGHFVGLSASIKGSRSPSTTSKQDLANRLKLWFIQMRAGIDTGGYQGLPQTGTTPLVHDGMVVAHHTTWVQS